MGAEDVLQQARQLPETERAAALAQATKEMSKDGQQVVASGIDKSAWPQDSMHRMITILGSVLLGLGAGAMAIWAASIDADAIATALIALATGIVGGIFGYAQASK